MFILDVFLLLFVGRASLGKCIMLLGRVVLGFKLFSRVGLRSGGGVALGCGFSGLYVGCRICPTFGFFRGFLLLLSSLLKCRSLV